MAAIDAALDCVLIDLLGCAMPRASAYASETSRSSGSAKFQTAAAYLPRPRYSAFDLLAGAGTNFLLNLSITAVVPMALMSAESRGHVDPLTGSGSVVGATSIGMMLSVVAFYGWSERLIDGKAPFFLFATLLIAGNGLFLLAELRRWPLDLLLAARATMALGFGAGFAAKRRAGLEADARQREYHFLRLELANSLGMAGGPIVSGSLAVLLPAFAPYIPPLLMIGLALSFLLLLALVPIDAPLAAAAPSLANESTPLVHGVATATPAAVGDDKEGAASAATTADASAAAGASHGGHGAPSLATSVVVQVAMLLFGVSRNFLKFGFESAMVVVYDRQFYFTPGASGVIAGCCALSTVFSLVLYRAYCARHLGTHRLLLIAEAFGLASAALMIATEVVVGGSASGVPLAAAAWLSREDGADVSNRRVAELLTLFASMLFYPAMYLGASIGNSHPLRFAVPDHPLLSRRSMLAQQEILQKTIGKGARRNAVERTRAVTRGRFATGHLSGRIGPVHTAA